MDKSKGELKMLNILSGEIDIEALYQKYGPMVLRRCRFLLKNEEKALDVMQEVFTKLLLNQKRLKNQYMSSLLYKISTNTCLNVLRDERSHREVPGDDLLMKIAAFDSNEQGVIIKDLLDRIFKKEKKSTREIAVMHFVDEMTLKEVADEIGLSLSGVRKRIRELRERTKIKKEIYNGQ